MKAVLHHVAVAIYDFDWYLDFFTRVCEMTVQRTGGDADHRIVWFDQGIQINQLSSGEVTGSSVDHICLASSDPDESVRLAVANGCTVLEGKPQWFVLPNGVKIEMKPL